jgi:hypothetical protein
MGVERVRAGGRLDPCARCSPLAVGGGVRSAVLRTRVVRTDAHVLRRSRDVHGTARCLSHPSIRAGAGHAPEAHRPARHLVRSIQPGREARCPAVDRLRAEAVPSRATAARSARAPAAAATALVREERLGEHRLRRSARSRARVQCRRWQTGAARARHRSRSRDGLSGGPHGIHQPGRRGVPRRHRARPCEHPRARHGRERVASARGRRCHAVWRRPALHLARGAARRVPEQNRPPVRPQGLAGHLDLSHERSAAQEAQEPPRAAPGRHAGGAGASALRDRAGDRADAPDRGGSRTGAPGVCARGARPALSREERRAPGPVHAVDR